MTRFNNFLNKNINLILLIFIILQPIIDVMTSLCVKFDISLSIGMIVRFTFMLLMIYYLFFSTTSKYKKKSIFILIPIFIFMLIYSIFNFSLHNISMLLKSFYFPILFICLFNACHENNNLENKYLLISLFIYVGIIFIGNLTGTSFNSYEIAKTGNVGWFNAANEVGAIIGILFPILFEAIYKKLNIIKIILLFLTIIISFQIGTRIPLISLLLCIIIYYIKYIRLFIKNKYKKLLIGTVITTLVALTSFIIILPKTPIYKNIIIHTKYLKIDSVDDIFRNPKTIDHFIFSERFKFLSNTNKIYMDSSINQKLLGINYENNKLIEMDYFDIFYNFGIVGFVIYFSSIISIFIIYKERKINKTYILPFSIILFIAFFAGHTFTAPAVSIYAIVILVKLISEKYDNKKNLLFCSYDLNVGGIETSLVNLLNNIDYDKYNVDLMLEKNRGSLLNKIPNNVKVFEYRVSENKNVFIRKMINLLKRISYIALNYKTYDFSCCYATYSLPCNIISRYSSNNSCFYIHTNYYMTFNEDINKIKEFFDVRALDQFRKIIFVSNEMERDLCKIYPNIKNKSEVINNIINSDLILDASNKNIDIEKSKDKKLFVFVGRIDEESKRFSRLIKMFSILKNKVKNIELWIVGNGKDYEYVQELIKKYKLNNDIKMLGEKSNPYPYMKLSDYIILTSDYEGFPVIYNEAIALNKKIITTIDVSDDYIKIPNNFGYIVSKDENEMATQIEDILKNDKLKSKHIEFNKINKDRIEKLEKIFEGVR